MTMKLDWTAVIIGFVVTIALGILSGLVYAGTDASVAVLYWGTIGILGGLTAGYFSGGSAGNGAYNGGVATVLGSLIVLVIAAFTTLLFGGLVASAGVVFVGVLILAFYAIPGAVGGAVGAWYRSQRTAEETMETRA